MHQQVSRQSPIFNLFHWLAWRSRIADISPFIAFLSMMPLASFACNTFPSPLDLLPPPAVTSSLVSSKLRIGDTGIEYRCSGWKERTRNTPRPGSANYKMLKCGPISIIKKETYKSCSATEGLGIPQSRLIRDRFKAIFDEYQCNSLGYLDNSPDYFLRDKIGLDYAIEDISDAECENHLCITTQCISDRLYTTTTMYYKIFATGGGLTLTTVEMSKPIKLPAPTLPQL